MYMNVVVDIGIVMIPKGKLVMVTGLLVEIVIVLESLVDVALAMISLGELVIVMGVESLVEVFISPPMTSTNDSITISIPTSKPITMTNSPNGIITIPISTYWYFRGTR